ncbi:MAG TPA: 30S ribosomal protein S20 [Candidatus Cloacimonetes bacterium]|nr:30S ribosomal protein S20 [Candidatus Cloacimonadota bacterium]HEX37544.1 30S ribosomal protein S20 [Candidatus Cloacimonadota bacterium]
MPDHKSCEKRLRSDASKKQRNHYVKKSISSMIKKIKKTTDYSEMQKLLPEAFSLIDKAVKKGVLHRNTADRKKSRLNKYVQSFGTK